MPGDALVYYVLKTAEKLAIRPDGIPQTKPFFHLNL
jgi:hypothetical protein